MDFDLTIAERDFRDEVRTWLEEHLVGEFAGLRGRGGMGQEDIPAEQQIAWERELAGGGWLGIDFPAHLGGRECSLSEQVLFHQTYVEARAPGRLPNMGVTLLGPTLVAYGTPEQQERFVPPILSGDEFWCQGYSEPNAGSDLANVGTKAVLDGDRWVVNGQKIWTSLAQYSDWCFVVCRTDPDSARHAGLSYLLVPMDQPGIEIRPIVQITGGTEFNEVFFDDAVTDADLVVGQPGRGWEVAMGTLAFERGASTLGQQTYFRQELDALLAEARASGTARRSGGAPRAGPGLRHVGDHAIQQPADAHGGGCRRGARAGDVHRQAVVVELAPIAGRADGGSAGGRCAGSGGRRRGLLIGLLAAHLLVQPSPHHLRGVERDSKKHHWRAGFGPASRAAMIAGTKARSSHG